ncbi:MAG: protein phosphatase 2C domain-containing protein [Pirellulales bacterium]
MRRDANKPLAQDDLKPTTSLDDATVDFVLRDETLRDVERQGRDCRQIDCAGQSHIGKVRPHNEDHYFIYRRRIERGVLDTNLHELSYAAPREDVYVFAVADGLGGHSFGELASAMTLQAQGYLGRGSWLAELAELEPSQVAAQATKDARHVHRKLLDEAQRNPQLRGMASTLTAAVVYQHRFVLIHLGDSRAYLLQGGEVSQISRDHTLAEEMRHSQVVDPRMVRMANVLTNCLGGDDGQLRVETREMRWGLGDQLLICSDGLSDVVSLDEIKTALTESPIAQEACNRLMAMALDRGGRDNITLVVARCVA